MIDDFERLVPLAHGEDPSPDFEAKLRERVIARAAEKAMGTAPEAPFEIELLADPEKVEFRAPRWGLMAAAAAAVLIAGFVVYQGLGDGEQVDTFDPVEPVTTTTAQPIEEVTTTTARPGQGVSAPAVLVETNAVIDAGSYAVDTFGTVVTFTVDDLMGVSFNENGRLTLEAVSTRRPTDRTIVFQRLSALSDPANPVVFASASEEWPATDVLGWLDGLVDGAASSEPTQTAVGGRSAVRFDMELDDDFECSRGSSFCVGFGTNHLVQNVTFEAGASYQVWVVDQEDEDPLAVVVSIDDESDLAWFDTADRLLASLSFGDIESNPLRTEVGETELDALGGIRLDLAAEQIVTEPFENFARVVVNELPADVEFLTNPLQFDGLPFETADDLISVLGDDDIQATELEAVLVDGVVARAFELATGRFPRPVVKRRVEEVGHDGSGWTPSEGGHLWLIEHSERGLLMVSAEAFADHPETNPLLRTWTENLLSSLEFIELG